MITDDIEAFLDAILVEEGLSENTTVAYGTDLRIFARYLKARGTVESGAVTHDEIVGFLREEREGGVAGSTRARRTAAIRMFFRYLAERHLLDVDPSELMDTPRKALVLPKVLSEEEVARMLDAVDGDAPREVRDRAILEVLYGSGLRVSELCDLKLDGLVADGELLRVLGKGSKERIVPMGRAAGRALERYLKSARAVFTKGDTSVDHLFVTRLGRRFTRQGVFKIVRERAAAVGISAERISPHVLRHCFASHMLAHGADIRAIQELLGHADIGTTQVYTHVDVARFGDIHKNYHPRAFF